MAKLTRPRKQSAQACTPLRKKRASVLHKVRMNFSGDTDADTLKQHGTELKRTSKAKKKIILKEAGSGEVSVSALQGTALRTQLGLSLDTYRQHKRILRKYGVKSVSEKKERKQQMKALCGEIKVEMRSLVFFNDIDQ